MDESKYRSKRAEGEACRICGRDARCEYENKYYCYAHIKTAVDGEY